jgi:uncharacterized alpha-E superfamily protein
MATFSNAKVNNLFWLGRYVQRVYLILHFIRKYRDEVIDRDDDRDAYKRFCVKAGIANIYTSNEDFMQRYLYDPNNSVSLIAALSNADNNATLLREEIKSESFAYIQMAICHIERMNDITDVEELQLVTDCMLAFWGSLDERMIKGEARSVIKAGKYLESLDLYLRFDYPHDRLLYILENFEWHAGKQRAVFDQILLFQLRKELEHNDYNKIKVLEMLSKVFVV